MVTAGQEVGSPSWIGSLSPTSSAIVSGGSGGSDAQDLAAKEARQTAKLGRQLPRPAIAARMGISSASR
jgi:hypothetical protein